MEIRARYVLMGVFTLAVLFAGFSFVFWLNNAGTLRDRAVYQVRLESSVSWLLTGSAVLFNGIRVGEVTKLDLNTADRRQVQATSGRIIAMRVFRASFAAEAANAPAAVAAPDRAFGEAGSDLVTWVGRAVNESTLPKAVLPRRTSGG